MTDAIDTYFLFSDSFDDVAKVQLYTALADIPEVETTESPVTIERRLSEGKEAFTWFSYKSLTPTLALTPNPVGIPDVPLFELTFESLSFDTSLHGQSRVTQHLAEAVELIVHLYELAGEVNTNPQYVVGADPTDTEEIRTGRRTIQFSTDRVLSGELDFLYWLQILSPQMVESLGRDIIESAPASRIDWLPDGSVLLIAFENPLQVTQEYLTLLNHFDVELH